MQSKENNAALLAQLAVDTKRYMELRLRHFHLDAVSRFTELLSVLAVTLLVILLVFLSLVVATIAAFLWLKTMMSHLAAFSLISGVYLFTLCLFIFFRDTLVTKPLSKLVGKILLEKKPSRRSSSSS